MPDNGYWSPPAFWRGQTVYIIGGGPSLKNVDWTPFHDKHVIGCNDAYKLGHWVDIVCFGDQSWYAHHAEGDGKEVLGLDNFKNIVMTFHNNFLKVEGVKVMRFMGKKGLVTKKGYIGWNQNTGALAFNLALILGATKIVLLGFDMKHDEDGNSNWHANNISFADEKTYDKFLRFWGYIKTQLDADFPHIEVVNATPGSVLPYFPIVEMKEVI